MRGYTAGIIRHRPARIDRSIITPMFAQQIINGVALGAVYALLALGYTMVYGILQLINFAHGEVYMLGAYLGIIVLGALTAPGMHLGIATALTLSLLITMLFCGAYGAMIERVAYRPLRHAPRLAPFISAIGVSIFLQNAILLWVSTKQLAYPAVLPIKPAFSIGGARITNLQVFIIVTAIALMFILDTFVSRTRIGKAMRATSQDRDAAGLMGISINTVIALAFFIGPALGGVAGVFSGLYYGSVSYSMGFIPGVKSFTAAVIGGIGNLRGAMLGGFVLGILESLAAGFLNPGYKDVVAFAVLILVLIFRPGGLLGESVVEKV